MTEKTSQKKTAETTETPTTAAKLREDLEARRDRTTAKATDRLERLRDRETRAADARQIRQEAARGRASAALERAKIEADIRQSAEARALRVQRTRTMTLAVLLPVLAAFAAWSTTGVHAGVTAMIGAETGSPMWWMLWLLEPALITAVGWIILSRSRLETSGGTLGEEANPIMWGCLSVSIALNAVGHWPSPFDWDGAGALLAHSLGPVGAATTAHLIGVIETAITQAKPTEGEGVRTLSELTTVTTQKSAQESPETTSESAPESPQEDYSRAHELARLAPAGAHRLAVVECCRPTAVKASKKVERSTDDQAERPVRKSAPSDSRKVRADRGTKVPAAAKPTPEPVSPRRLSDVDLAVALQERIDSRELPESPTVKAVQESLSVGFERAKRVLALQQERTETVAPGQLSVVEAAREADNVAA